MESSSEQQIKAANSHCAEFPLFKAMLCGT
nr:MAG TPA: hypothetical protein [Caudoviricetes sp.]